MNENNETKSLRVDHRHLAFFFIGAVAVCAVFFALGFVVGRAQAFETALKEAETTREGANGSAGVPAAAPVGEISREPEGAAASAGDSDKLRLREAAPASNADYRKELDFYSAVKDQRVDQNFHPEKEKTRKVSSPAAEKARTELAAIQAASSKGKTDSSAALISLQVAALKSSAEADKLARALRKKGYPVFVVNPSREDPSKLVRVQIGPYTSEAEAARMKSRLGAEGYTVITKR